MLTETKSPITEISHFQNILGPLEGFAATFWDNFKVFRKFLLEMTVVMAEAHQDTNVTSYKGLI